MTTDLERELTRTLAGAAWQAPEPGEGFVVGVRKRRRARKRRQLAALASCAVVLAVGSGMVAVRLSALSDERRPAPSADERVPAASWSGTLPDFEAAGSPDKVWPNAVHRLPARLPNGAGYQVYAVLRDDRYLVRTIAESSTVWAPSVFDARTGKLTYLGSDELATDREPSPDNWATAVGERAVWFSSESKANEQDAVIWTARLDGTGDPQRIATVPNHIDTLSRVGVTGDTFFWYESKRGLFGVPISGGTPSPIPGGAEYAWLDLSPWVSTSRQAFTDDGSREGVLWNLKTADRRPWKAHPRVRDLLCYPVLCVGWDGSYKTLVQPLDGSRVLEPSSRNFRFYPAIEGAFGVGEVETSRGFERYVWDLATGQAATVSAGQEVYDGYERSTLQWPADGETIYVLDLRAIR
jgi:hypothetical protein